LSKKQHQAAIELVKQSPKSLKMYWQLDDKFGAVMCISTLKRHCKQAQLEVCQKVIKKIEILNFPRILSNN
jgi:hypothetical protein